MGALRGSSKLKLFQGGAKVKKAYLGTQKVYSSGNIVTYVVDNGETYLEEVDEGVSVLTPSSFTPAKSGWKFVGWREDKTASGDVLDSKIMGDEPVTLYAVFSREITLSYNGNGSTSGSTSAQTGKRYYNNGNIVDPSFLLKSNGFTKTNYAFINWAMGTASGTQYTVGANVTLTESKTFYAVWEISKVYVYDSSTSLSCSLSCDEPGVDWWDENKTNSKDSSQIINFSLFNYIVVNASVSGYISHNDSSSAIYLDVLNSSKNVVKTFTLFSKGGTRGNFSSNISQSLNISDITVSGTIRLRAYVRHFSTTETTYITLNITSLYCSK